MTDSVRQCKQTETLPWRTRFSKTTDYTTEADFKFMSNNRTLNTAWLCAVAITQPFKFPGNLK